MWTEIKGLFGKGRSSRDVAKGRLHLVLAHDRVGLEGGKLEEMREEIALVISRYVAIDADSVEVQVETVSRQQTQLTVSSPLPVGRPAPTT